MSPQLNRLSLTIRVNISVSNKYKVHLLLDCGADVNILKSEKLTGAAGFKPKNKVKIKTVVDESMIEIHGTRKEMWKLCSHSS
jgi:hypothetical protein